MFDVLNMKINTYAQIPEQSLDSAIVADFDSANYYFALVEEASQYPGLTGIELIVFYLSQGLQFEKAAMETMFTQWKEKLFEFDKVEKKLYYLGKGSKYQKEAKEISFKSLEEKLDTLFAWREWDPIPFPPLADTLFDSANTYFGLVNSTHEDISIPELDKIVMKIHYLNSGFQYQKDATRIMFLNLEEKLDLLLERDFVGLPDTVSMSFDSANYYFDYPHSVPPVEGELEHIEYVLDTFAKALKFAKDAKWLMFDELEKKIDSLPETGVREMGEVETVPERFVLLQNYPNPFNPATNIQFMIPEPAQVKIEIFNVLGKKIVTLVDEKLGAGHKIVEWDGKDDQGIEVSTGIYFYRLKAGEFTQTRKMVLLK